MNKLAIYASLLVPVVAVVAAGWIAHEPAIPPAFGASGPERQDWSAYGGAPENNHYSALAQINKSNVKRLAVAWKFDSGIRGTQPDRGLAYWADGKDKRILAGVMNFLYALDAATGKPIPGFGIRGRIDLREK